MGGKAHAINGQTQDEEILQYILQITYPEITFLDSSCFARLLLYCEGHTLTKLVFTGQFNLFYLLQ